MKNDGQIPIWDVHHHWVNETHYIEQLLHQMDRLGIERTGLIAMGDFVPDLFLSKKKRDGCANNSDLAKLVRSHPDRFWGWGFIRLGRHQSSDVENLVDMGLTGLKFHAPLKPYSASEYFDVYHRANQHGLPCLFHTGIFLPPTPMPGEGIFSENYRPIHLEPIAHEFPSLKMIAAHLGVCWNDEAATLARMFPNIYVDISGNSNGWRASKSLEWFKQIFYWPQAHKKILFGSDVHADLIAQAVEDYNRIFSGIGWDEQQIADVFYRNAKTLVFNKQ